jgi:hypothetical protein
MENQFENTKLFVSNDETVTLEANPDVYDYLHRITLNFKTKEFELLDGGGQMITGNIFGSFGLKNGILTLKYLYDYNCYTGEKIPLNLTKHITFSITNEEKKHFDGYCMQLSTQTITLSESPFVLDEIESRRNGTLFNMLNNNKIPLTFYNDLHHISCDTKYERFIRDEVALKKLYHETIEKDDDILIPLDENTRSLLIAKDDIPHGWFVIKFNMETKELIGINYNSNLYVKRLDTQLIVKSFEEICNTETSGLEKFINWSTKIFEK